MKNNSVVLFRARVSGPGCNGRRVCTYMGHLHTQTFTLWRIASLAAVVFHSLYVTELQRNHNATLIIELSGSICNGQVYEHQRLTFYHVEL